MAAARARGGARLKRGGGCGTLLKFAFGRWPCRQRQKRAAAAAAASLSLYHSSALCLGLLLTLRLKFLDLLMGCMWLGDVEKKYLSKLEYTDAYLSDKCHFLKNLLFSTNKI